MNGYLRNTPLYPLDHSNTYCITVDKKTQYNEKVRYMYLPNRTENEKFPPIYRIISVDKKVCRKNTLYGGKKKSSLLAEKKPAYGKIKKYSHNCFKFGK